MPPRKRKAANAATTSASSRATNKRLRLDDQSLNGDSTVSASGRTRRSTSNDNPQYNFTRKRSTSGGFEETKAPASAAMAGRGKGKGKTTAKQTGPAPKKRGRPPKAKEPDPEPEPEAVEEGAVEEEVMGAPSKQKARKGILKNIHDIQQTVAEPVVQYTAKGGQSKLQAAAAMEIKPAKARGRPKKHRSEDDGLTDEEALNKGAAMLANEYTDPEIQYWLMKAEPESRIEKGVDVKFSIDDLLAKGEPEEWDGENIYRDRLIC
jgi:hypothetical protein